MTDKELRKWALKQANNTGMMLRVLGNAGDKGNTVSAADAADAIVDAARKYYDFIGETAED